MFTGKGRAPHLVHISIMYLSAQAQDNVSREYPWTLVSGFRHRNSSIMFGEHESERSLQIKYNEILSTEDKHILSHPCLWQWDF